MTAVKTRLDEHDELDEPTRQEVEEAMRRMPPEVLPLEYASRLRPAGPAPFDWPGVSPSATCPNCSGPARSQPRSRSI